MYVTRRLLRSTMEETSAPDAVKVEAAPQAELPFSPRKRRPLAQSRTVGDGAGANANKSNKSKKTANKSQSTGHDEGGSLVEKDENKGDTQNDKSGATATATSTTEMRPRGLGMLIDARDTLERWCEAKILDVNVAEKRVYVHYVGWNVRYDCWLSAKCLAAHGRHTGMKTKAGKSWNGKESLFVDPAQPSPPPKSTRTKVTAAKTLPVASASKKKRAASGDMSASNKKVKTEPVEGVSQAFKRPPNYTDGVAKVEVGVDAVDEESERKSRRVRNSNVDLELNMEVRGDTGSSAKKEAGGGPSKRARTSPIAKESAAPLKPPTCSQTQHKASPRKASQVDAPASKNEESSESVAIMKALSPTVGVSVLRRSARAARTAVIKKCKKDDDDDSDEDYMDNEAAEEDEEDDDEEDEEDEADESEDEVVRCSSSSGKARRTSSSAPRNHGSGVINQWQTDPACIATRERLATIFRQRMVHRGEIGAAFHGSFQQAMSESSEPSTPRNPPLADGPTEKAPSRTSKKKKKASGATSAEEEEKAAAARYYYAQHYYQMQAYQYQQYLQYHAWLAQQHQNRATDDSESKEDGAKGGDDDAEEKREATPSASSSPKSQELVMNGGIIDHRFIHARMDALEHQRRLREQIYLQHYSQVTERNLQMLAATPEYLRNGASAWQAQVQNAFQPPRSAEVESNAIATEPGSGKEAEVNEGEKDEKEVGEPSVTEDVNSTKDDEPREPEDTSHQQEGNIASPVSPSRSHTPTVAVKCVETRGQAASPCLVVVQKDAALPEKEDLEGGSSPAESKTSMPKREAVLFELEL